MLTQRRNHTARRGLLVWLTWLTLMASGLLVAQAQWALANGMDAVQSSYNLESPETVSKLRVTVHKSQTVRIQQPFTEALIGQPKIADVIPLTDKSIYVLGKQVGTTRLSILGKDKKLLGIIEVEVAFDADAIQAHFKRSLPRSRIRVASVNGRIMLTGMVSDGVALEKAIAIANQYAPEAVSNQLTVAGSQQVLLEVRFVEASRTATRNLGVSWNIASRQAGSHALNTNLPGGVGLGAFPTTVLPFGSMVARLLNAGTSAEIIIQALEEKGLARRLAEPNLVALSGDTASFLAGGEFPFPVGRDNDSITIEFKKFGVGLGFTPTVLSNGLINLKIEPEVSEIDPNNTLVVNDTTIPGLVTRRAKTTVELRDGQSFAIAGLLQANHSKARRQLPWLGQVPVLGSLFRSASFEKQETDLVIIVTPRLVNPAAPGDRLATPFDKALPGNDVDYFLNGKDEIPNWKARFRRSGKVNRRAPSVGHMLGNSGPIFPKVSFGKGSVDRSTLTGSVRRGDPRDITGSIPKPGKSKRKTRKPSPLTSKPSKKKPASKKAAPSKKTKSKAASKKDEKDKATESKGLLGGLFKGGLLGGALKSTSTSEPKPRAAPRLAMSLDLDGGP